MSEVKTIVQENIIHFLKDFQSAVREGYFVDNTNAGYPMLSGVLKEITLYAKPKCGVKRVACTDAVITVEAYDSFEWLMKLQTAIIESYNIDFSTLYFESLKSVQLKKAGSVGSVEVPKELVQAVKPTVENYSTEDLKEMSYDQLKQLAEQLGDTVFNRKKTVLIKNIRNALDERFNSEDKE